MEHVKRRCTVIICKSYLVALGCSYSPRLSGWGTPLLLLLLLLLLLQLQAGGRASFLPHHTASQHSPSQEAPPPAPSIPWHSLTGSTTPTATYCHHHLQHPQNSLTGRGQIHAHYHSGIIATVMNPALLSVPAAALSLLILGFTNRS
jgi:hypothetical protein